MNETKTMEAEAFPKMLALLEDYGLQITLKTLADALAELIRAREFSSEACMAEEVIRGLHAGYLRRYEDEE
jgi:hypothetical protein